MGKKKDLFKRVVSPCLPDPIPLTTLSSSSGFGDNFLSPGQESAPDQQSLAGLVAYPGNHSAAHRYGQGRQPLSRDLRNSRTLHELRITPPGYPGDNIIIPKFIEIQFYFGLRAFLGRWFRIWA